SRYRAAYQAQLPDHAQTDAAAGNPRRADQRKGEDQGSQEIWRRSLRQRYRSGLYGNEPADAAVARTAHQIPGEPGRPAGNAEVPPQGRDGLEQPGARPLQGEPA